MSDLNGYGLQDFVNMLQLLPKDNVQSGIRDKIDKDISKLEEEIKELKAIKESIVLNNKEPFLSSGLFPTTRWTNCYTSSYLPPRPVEWDYDKTTLLSTVGTSPFNTTNRCGSPEAHRQYLDINTGRCLRCEFDRNEQQKQA